MAMNKNPFNGNLNSNEIFSAIYNMIIDQQVFSDNYESSYGSLVDKCRVDGSLYGDTKLYYASDALGSYRWTNDSEANNLLQLHRPADPICQAVTIDQFRFIPLTVDNYLSKRAWGTEGAFSQFNSVMLGWIRVTKQIYDTTLFNAFVGTVEGNSNTKTFEIPLSDIQATGEEKNRLEGQMIAEYMANLVVKLKDISRDFNDYQFIRAFKPNKLRFIWNSAWVNRILKTDLPTIYHKEGLMESLTEDVLPDRYFGHISTSATLDARVYDADTNPTGDVTKSSSTYTIKTSGAIRTLVEATLTISDTEYHLFPGDALPVGATIAASGTPNFAIGEVYEECADIICKVVHKNSFPFMSAFEVATEFFNPRSLTENHYLIWGYSQPDYLRNYPLITVEAD